MSRGQLAGCLFLVGMACSTARAPTSTMPPAPDAASGNCTVPMPHPPFALVFEELPTPAGANSMTPFVDVDPDGVVRLSWQEREGDETKLRFARWQEDDWSAPVTIATGTDWFVNWADFPALVGAGDGRLVAHWLERLSDDTYAYGVRVVLSADDGATWSEPRWLHDDRSEAEHGFASFIVATDEPPGFEAVWLDGRGTVGGNAVGGHDGAEGDMALMRRRIGLDGRLGAEELLDARVCSCCQTDVARSATGAVLTVYRDRSPTEVRDIGFTLGEARGAVHDDGWEINGCPVNGPAVATDSATGRSAAAWFTGAGGGGGAVRVAFRGPEDDAFGPPIEVDRGAPEGRVDAAFLADGTLVVTWMEHGEQGAEWRACAMAADGVRVTSRALAPVSSDRRSGFLRMAARGDAAVVAWTDLSAGSQVLVGCLRLVWNG